MEKINLVNNTHRVDACFHVESNALVFIMVPAAKNIVGMIALMLSFILIFHNCSPSSRVFNCTATYCKFLQAISFHDFLKFMRLFFLERPQLNLHLNFVSGAQKVAKIGSGDVTVLRVNAEVGSAHVLLLDVNVTQMYAEIAGSGIQCQMHVLQLLMDTHLSIYIVECLSRSLLATSLKISTFLFFSPSWSTGISFGAIIFRMKEFGFRYIIY